MISFVSIISTVGVILSLSFPKTAVAELRELINTSVIPSDQLPKNIKGVEVKQKLGAQIPLDLSFTDELGHTIHLFEIVRDKPVILTLAYYKCPSLCTLVLNGLVSALREIKPTLGKDYIALTVSIHPKETSALALAKKRSYLSHYTRGSGFGDVDQDPSWRFLTGQEDVIRKLSESVGFSYLYDISSGQYSHASVIMILTPEGKISQYLFGIRFLPQDLEKALAKASISKIGSPLNQLLLYCFHYDPSTGHRTLRILNILKIIAVLTLLGIIVALTRFYKMEQTQ